MIYLILAVLCSASMALALRISEEFSDSRYGILFGNYLTCLVIAFFLLPEKNLLPAGGRTAVLAGAVNGGIFLLTLVLMQRSIEKNGAVLSSAFAKLGILLPVLGSILFLGEKPTVLQMAGMILVAAAILMIHLEPERRGRRRGSRLHLLALFFSSGMADGMSKVFEHIGERRFDALFLFYTFLFAELLTVILLVREQRGRRRRRGTGLSAADLVCGIFVGIPNYFSTSLLLAAVTKLPAYVAYPCYSVGTILVVSFVSVLLLKDRMTRRQAAGSGLILAALVLLNL